VTTAGSDGDVAIYHGGGVIVERLQTRFRVNVTIGGNQNLVISTVSFDDAGKYTCIDESGFGSHTGQLASAELTVIGLTF